MASFFGVVMKLVVAGGSGVVGKRVVDEALRQGHSVVVLSRSGSAQPGVTSLVWDGKTAAASWADEVRSSDAVINLSGSNIGKGRWTKRRLREALDSRTESTRVLANVIAHSEAPPALVNVSAVGFYGFTMDPTTEASPAGTTILSDLCRMWEAEAMVVANGTRVVIARIGVVLDPSAGALQKMMLPFRLGLGGPLGDGRQHLPWIHRDDVARALVYLATTEQCRGVYNLVANSVTMDEFASTLGRVLRRPAIFRVPKFVLRLLLGRQADVVIHGQNVVRLRTIVDRVPIHHLDLESALHDLLDRRN